MSKNVQNFQKCQIFQKCQVFKIVQNVQNPIFSWFSGITAPAQSHATVLLCIQTCSLYDGSTDPTICPFGHRGFLPVFLPSFYGFQIYLTLFLFCFYGSSASSMTHTIIAWLPYLRCPHPPRRRSAPRGSVGVQPAPSSRNTARHAPTAGALT